MRFFLTGGAGFIGSHLVGALLEQGHSVNVLDDLSTGSRANIRRYESHPEFHFQLGNAADPIAVEPLILSADVVFHLAASVGVANIVQNPIRCIENNIESTSLVLKLCDKLKKRVITFSTSEVYGKSPRIPFEESADVVLGPVHKLRWSYAASKLVDDYLARAYFTQNGTAVTIVRLFNTIGQGQIGHYGMVVPRFFEQALNNQPITVYGDGEQTRCFTDVRDVVAALVALIPNRQSYGELINIGSSEEVSILRLATLIKTLARSSSPIQFTEFETAYGSNFEDMQRRVPSTQKLKALSGFSFRYNLNQTLEWVLAGLQPQAETPARQASV